MNDLLVWHYWAIPYRERERQKGGGWRDRLLKDVASEQRIESVKKKIDIYSICKCNPARVRDKRIKT